MGMNRVRETTSCNQLQICKFSAVQDRSNESQWKSLQDRVTKTRVCHLCFCTNMLFQGQVQSHLVFYKVDQVGELYTKSVVCLHLNVFLRTVLKRQNGVLDNVS